MVEEEGEEEEGKEEVGGIGDCWGGVAGLWWPGLGLVGLEGSIARGLFWR